MLHVACTLTCIQCILFMPCSTVYTLFYCKSYILQVSKCGLRHPLLPSAARTLASWFKNHSKHGWMYAPSEGKRLATVIYHPSRCTNHLQTGFLAPLATDKYIDHHACVCLSFVTLTNWQNIMHVNAEPSTYLIHFLLEITPPRVLYKLKKQEQRSQIYGPDIFHGNIPYKILHFLRLTNESLGVLFIILYYRY